MSKAIPAIAALSVQSDSGGMNSSTPIVVGHRGEPLAEPGVGRHAAADPQPLQAGPLEGLAGLGDEDVDHRLLKLAARSATTAGAGWTAPALLRSGPRSA